MNESPEIASERAAIQHLVRRLDGFRRGLELDEAMIRQIVEAVFADISLRTDEDRLIEARTRMIMATV